MLFLLLTHQTVAVPAARAPAQITTRQLIELFFSSQAGGHCKNIPTLEYGFLVQVRHQWQMIVTIKAFAQLVHGVPIIVQNLDKDVHEQDKMDHNWLTLGYLEKRSMFCCVLFFFKLLLWNQFF